MSSHFAQRKKKKQKEQKQKINQPTCHLTCYSPDNNLSTSTIYYLAALTLFSHYAIGESD